MVYGLPRLGAVFGPWLLAWQPGGRSTVPHSAGVVFGPWLLCKAARKGFLFRSLPPSFLLFIYTNYLLRLPGCYAKQPGGSTVCRAQRVRFSVPGCSRGSQGGSLGCAAIGWHGFRSLAALRSSQGRFAVPFPSPLFFLFIDTNYILRVPGR